MKSTTKTNKENDTGNPLNLVRIGYEDENMAIVWKPVGLVTSGRGSSSILTQDPSSHGKTTKTLLQALPTILSEEKNGQNATGFGLGTVTTDTTLEGHERKESAELDNVTEFSCLTELDRSISGWILVSKTVAARQALINSVIDKKDNMDEVGKNEICKKALPSSQWIGTFFVVCQGPPPGNEIRIHDPHIISWEIHSICPSRNCPTGYLWALSIKVALFPHAAGFFQFELLKSQLFGILNHATIISSSIMDSDTPRNAGLAVLGTGGKCVAKHPGTKSKGTFCSLIGFSLCHPFSFGRLSSPEQDGRVSVVTDPPAKFLTFLSREEQAAKKKKTSDKYSVPLAYEKGEALFYKRLFFVERCVMVPRQPTEVVVEEAIKIVESHTSQVAVAGLNSGSKQLNVHLVDLGTGSGCILITLMLELERKMFSVTGVGLDISKEALHVSQRNAARYDLGSDKIRFTQGSFETFPRHIYTVGDLNSNRLLDGSHDETIHLVVCNPPYLTHRKAGSFSKTEFLDPELAMIGGEDGLDAYRAIASAIPSFLSSSVSLCNHFSYLLLEIGHGIASNVTDLFQRVPGVQFEALHRDQQNLERVLVFSLHSETR